MTRSLSFFGGCFAIPKQQPHGFSAVLGSLPSHVLCWTSLPRGPCCFRHQVSPPPNPPQLGVSGHDPSHTGKTEVSGTPGVPRFTWEPEFTMSFFFFLFGSSRLPWSGPCHAKLGSGLDLPGCKFVLVLLLHPMGR